MTEGNGQNGNGSASEETPARIGHVKKRAFIAAFAQSGNVRAAVEAAAIGRSTHYEWLRTDPDYVRAVEIAKQDAIDILEAAAAQRAVTGVRKYLYHNGQPVVDLNGAHLFEMRFSDVLLIFLLKGLRPDKYRERYDFSGETELRLVDHRVMLDQVSKDPQLKQLMRETQKRMRELEAESDNGQNGSNGSNGSNNGGE